MKLQNFLTIVTILSLLIWPGLLYSQTGTFVSFDAQPCEGNIVIIQWSIAPEQDTLSLEVERSRDKITWEKISRQPSQSSHQYFSIDSRPVNGVAYYRVRQTASGDKVAYSPVKWVQISNTEELYIWPNPARDILHVKTPFVKGSIDILDVEGKPVQRIAINAFSTEVPTTSLKNGIYYLHIQHDGEVLVEKFVKE